MVDAAPDLELATVIDRKPMANPCGWRSAPQGWRRVGRQPRVEIAMRTHREGAQDAGAKPVRRFNWRKRADHARTHPGVVIEWKHDRFELEGCAIGVVSARTDHHADGFLSDDGEEIANEVFAVRLPKFHEALALKLAPEGSTDACTGDAERMTGTMVEAQYESVGKHPANSAGLDIAALRGGSQPAALVPIIEQLTNRRMLHRRRCPCDVLFLRFACP